MKTLVGRFFPAVICGLALLHFSPSVRAQEEDTTALELAALDVVEKIFTEKRDRLDKELRLRGKVIFCTETRWFSYPRDDFLRLIGFLQFITDRKLLNQEAFRLTTELPPEFWKQFSGKSPREVAEILDGFAKKGEEAALEKLQEYNRALDWVHEERERIKKQQGERVVEDRRPERSVQPAADELPTEWKQTESSTSGTYNGTWKIDRVTGKAEATWSNGAKATLHVERIGDEITITRDDKDGATKGLKAEYKGKVEGRKVKGTVTWTSASGRVVKGTWEAEW